MAGHGIKARPGHDAAVLVRRFVNEQIAQVANDFDADEGNLFEFVCECGDLSCDCYVDMTVAAYRGCAPGSVVAHQVAD